VKPRRSGVSGRGQQVHSAIRRRLLTPLAWQARPAPWLPRQRAWLAQDAQATFCRRRHQPSRPPPAKIRPGRPAPTFGIGTAPGGHLWQNRRSHDCSQCSADHPSNPEKRRQQPPGSRQGPICAWCEDGSGWGMDGGAGKRHSPQGRVIL
jgi:hypothetical protein